MGHSPLGLLMKSRFLLFRPKAVDLSPYSIQDEIVKALCSMVSCV